MNYHPNNSFPYPQIARQRFPPTHVQPPMPQYGGYQTYLSMQNQSHYNNSYDHLIQSAAETLAAFTSPSERSILTNYQIPIAQANTKRPPVTNSSNGQTSTRMYYCETCRIECGGRASYQAHLNGSKHMKKEATSQSQLVNSNTFRCELCDIICTGADAYKLHINGSKHEKTVKLYHKLGKTIPEPVPQLSIPVGEPKTVIRNTETPSMKTSERLLGTEYIETVYDDRNMIRFYHCKLCDCKFNDSNTKNAHLNGKRHRLAYKKKVDVPIPGNDDNKLSNPNEMTESANDRQNNHSLNQIEFDDDTKYLMMLHEQIIPTQSLLNTVEEFVSAIEAALKSISDQLQSLNNLETTAHKSPLMGISRVGSLVKNLMIKSDRLFHLIVVCTEWPTRNLIEKVFSLLSENFHKIWKQQINIQYEKVKEIIQIHRDTNEGTMSVIISFTSLSTESEDNQTTEQFLSKRNCLNALNAMHSVRWFQRQVSIRQHASALIRCLRYKSKISSSWQSLSSEAIEILIEHILSKSISAIYAFRRVLEYLSGGLVLPNSPGLRIPWQTDSIKDVFDGLSDQERHDITQEAQIGLRLMAFGQLYKWFEQSDISPDMISTQKRAYSYSESQNSTKRQCMNLEKIDK